MQALMAVGLGNREPVAQTFPDWAGKVSVTIEA